MFKSNFANVLFTIILLILFLLVFLSPIERARMERAAASESEVQY